MKKISFCGIVLAALLGLFLNTAVLANNTVLPGKHTALGIPCIQCHGVAAPTTAAPDTSCLTCHGGSYEALAKTTEKLDPNPHYTHLGDMPCMECHNEHKPSVNMCSSCHNLDMKVP